MKKNTKLINEEIIENSTCTIFLNAGDYVRIGFKEKEFIVEVSIFYPDSSRIRKFNMCNEPEGISFIGDIEGEYRIQLHTRDRAFLKNFYIKEIQSVDERMTQQANIHTYKTPVLNALNKQEAGSCATATFWDQVKRTGTPVITDIPDDPYNKMVTFLWQEKFETHNVVLLGSFSNKPASSFLMRREPGTDVWHLTLRLPADARFIYYFSVNDPLVDDGPRASERSATIQADPLNPLKSWDWKEGSDIYDYSSMAELPEALPQPWLAKREGIPQGKREMLEFKSKLLNNNLKIQVYRPPHYDYDVCFNDLLVIFDGDAYVELVPSPTILDNLLSEKKITPTIAIFVSNSSQEKRFNELAPNPLFADFIALELVPWVCNNYRVTTESDRCVIAGSSLGGLAATYTAFRHPEIFGAVLCQSGSFWWAPNHMFGDDPRTETGWMAKQYIVSPRLSIRFYMEAGFFELDNRGSGGGILETSRHMRDVLLAKGYDVTYREYASGHDYLNWRGTFADGLIYLHEMREGVKYRIR